MDISNHTPLLLDTSRISSGSTYNMFKFELGWLLRDSFANMVKNIWINENTEQIAM
jgi:hypothetical protein